MPVEKDMVAMFEDAYKQQPNNEELGAQTFFANVRATNWKAAQQASSFSSTWVKDHRMFLKIDCNEDEQTVSRFPVLILDCNVHHSSGASRLR